uniref:Serine/threonine-protein phosphatase 4 regulatory subunit 2 n=1 Tax=Palpitomonas bilix TaxID=652834 RepID=A0A7S3G6C1_9EUKA|mmetsp:Transcript_2518/g.5278  ORF Transcript_2518/g.5278 Transcript_2518/m.5278 type:complete len:232 (+) Transcript_2518:199-894(+)
MDEKTYTEAKQALETFDAESTAIEGPLATIIPEIAKHGCVWFDWKGLCSLLKARIMSATAEMNAAFPDCQEDIEGESFDHYRLRLIGLLDSLDGPPFTIQRLCELLHTGSAMYRSSRKYLYALEKLVSVSSTVPVVGFGEQPPKAGEGDDEEDDEGDEGDFVFGLPGKGTGLSDSLELYQQHFGMKPGPITDGEEEMLGEVITEQGERIITSPPHLPPSSRQPEASNEKEA